MRIHNTLEATKMVLHIAITGKDKETFTNKLSEFFRKKQYKLTTRKQPNNQLIISILNNNTLLNHEKALLQAFDRSYTYYSENWTNYDLAIWTGNTIEDYHLCDEKTNPNYIREINKYFPNMDLIINIGKTQHHQNNTININYTTEDTTFENIVKTCFDRLPRCKWCGRIFTKTTTNKKYCTTKCRKEGRKEQNRENNRNYYNRYKDILTERQKGQLGSKGANLHSKRDPDFEKEKEKIQKGMKAIGLK